MAALRVHRITGAASSTSAKFRAYRVTGDGTGATQQRLRAYQVGGDAGAGLVTVAAFSTVPEVEPGTTRSRTAVLSSSNGAGVAWSWTQVSGPPVDLVADGPTVTFEAPAIMPTTDPNVVLGVTATVNGVTSAQVRATHTILPQTDWVWDGTDWVGSTPQIVGA